MPQRAAFPARFHARLFRSISLATTLAVAAPKLAAAAPTLADLVPEVADAASNGVWVPLDPPARQSFSLVRDAARNRLVLFGGYRSSGSTYNDVWSLSLQGPAPWRIERPLGTPPSARMDQATAYDSRRGRMLVFGGFSSGDLNDIWALDLEDPMSWQPLAPQGTPPSPREFASAVYDSSRDRMLLLGGVRNDGTLLNDLWELSLSGMPTWTQLSPAGTQPPARGAAAMIVDPVRDRLVLFGGNGPYLGDDTRTWVLNLSGAPEWQQLETSGQPPRGLYGQGGIYDPVGDRLVTIDGLNESTPLALSLGGSPTWTRLVPSFGAGTQPPGRYQNGAVYDPARRALVIYGGYVNSSLDDTWSFSLDDRTWTKLAPQGGSLPARQNHTANLDPATNRVIVFGGQDPFDRNDVWAMHLGPTSGWDRLNPAGAAPQQVYNVAAACDTRRHRMLYFGGRGTFSGASNTVSVLDLGATPAWSTLSTTGTPPTPRSGATAIYDAEGDRLLIFGGFPSTGFDPTNEVWCLSLSGTPTWSQWSPGSGPSGRAWAMATHDAARQRMLLFGGWNYDYYNNHNDVWALSLGGTPSWTLIAPSGTAPEGRSHAIAVLDSARDRLLIHGGGYTDTWALNLSGAPQWAELHPAAPTPEARGGSAGVYDPVGDRLIEIGGQGRNYNYLGDSWALVFSHLITASAGGGGSIAPSGTVLVRDGDDQTFTITADPCHVIADVMVDGQSRGPLPTYSFTGVTVDHTIAARFERISIPPEIVVSVTPTALWPPDNRLVDVHATVEARGLCDPAPTWTLTSITRTGDGQGEKRSRSAAGEACVVGADWGTPDVDFQLRSRKAENDGGAVYAVVYTVTDRYGNSASATAEVRVPHDMRDRNGGDNASAPPSANARDAGVLAGSVTGSFVPALTQLGPARPCPSVDSATLAVDVASADNVRLEVFDLRGARVRTLWHGAREAGRYFVVWDGTDHSGRRLADGVYLVRMEAGRYLATRKVVLAK